MGDPLKIVLAGPKKCGKSAIANLIANSELPESIQLAEVPYMETSGVRILEFEVSTKRNGTVPIELWDCSGDIKYESCWPAILSGASAIILMYNPENATQSGEVEQWFHWFVTKPGFKDRQCLVFANDCRNGHDDPDQPPPRSMRNAKFARVDADSQHEIIQSFQEFLEEVL